MFALDSKKFRWAQSRRIDFKRMDAAGIQRGQPPCNDGQVRAHPPGPAWELRPAVSLARLAAVRCVTLPRSDRTLSGTGNALGQELGMHNAPGEVRVIRAFDAVIGRGGTSRFSTEAQRDLRGAARRQA